jgi:GNAT superfamily N-acetyltransferase
MGEMRSGSGAVVRLARFEEAEEVAEVWLASRHAAAPQIPSPVHTDDEVRVWFSTRMFRSDQEVWVIEEQGRICGLLVLSGNWIEQLYIHPQRTGQGLGSWLIEHTQATRSFLQLWTFQSNLGARRFYERHGFIPKQRTDGDNEEGAPDERFEWHASGPTEPPE